MSGNMVAITDGTGAVAARFAYTPFGEVLEMTIVNPVCDIPVGFAGEYGVLREPNGLYYMNARYYDPTMGRFISEDPIGLSGGDLTLYSYAGNNPVVFVDPSGLCGTPNYVAMGSEPGLQSPLFDPVAIASGALGAKAFNALSGMISSGSVYEGMSIYRVYGDGAGAFGRSWTPVNPGTVANYRYAAGLPAQNSGRFIIEGTLNSTSGVTSRAALRIGANAGGLPEILIPNASAQVNVLRVMGVNPPF